ncbi:MAG TPA: 3-methyl-2-oxobutanoate hydroxymethyltransferase [Armatimonadetes bacterium]|jgi:3-methyl-2-oxobutanoate hydroxymethyltransferase|nr:3-methyl-2-oxobutanoate hydroxymethyltransferase [Armatimonadota bacterium]
MSVTQQRPRVTVPRVVEMKARGEKVVMVTAYDTPTARLADEAGVDLLLVGDSLGMVALGYESTIPVTMEEMLHHTRAVAHGARRALVVGDLPFLSYQASADDAILNAGRMLKEGGARAVKLEGGEGVAPLVRRMVGSGIPVVGHVGLLPQSVHQMGGFRVQGKTAEAARQVLRDALALQDAGAFAVVLEAVPAPLAEAISARLSIPTIGIGAGAGCDGQVQVVTDLLGLSERLPKHARAFLDLSKLIREAFEAYAAEVRAGSFPGPENATTMDDEELRKALADERDGTD